MCNFPPSALTPCFLSCFMCSANWIKFHGTKYQTPCAITIGVSSEKESRFGHVVSILVYSKVYFEFELLETQSFDHYHAFSLSIPPASSKQKYLIKQANLPSFHPLRMYRCNNISTNRSFYYTVLRSNIYA